MPMHLADALPSRNRYHPARPRRLAMCKHVLLPLVMMSGIMQWQMAQAAAEIHKEPSQFSSIVVYEARGERCMSFGSIHAAGRQTCIDLEHPQKMVFSYTRMMMGALLLAPQPRRILIIGLGGGTLSQALHTTLPEAHIDNVDIDPAVVRVAERFFGFQPDEQQRIFIDDGRQFVERALAEGRQYDLVMLDAFGVDYIPQHLMSREFLTMVRGILAPQGVLAANTFAGSRLYDRESATYFAVFGPYFNLRSGNRVILARPAGLPDEAELKTRANNLAAELAPFGVDAEALLRQFQIADAPPAGALPIADPAG